MIWHYIFFYKEQYIGNSNSFAEAFNSVPTYSWKLHFCCPGTESSCPQEGITSGDVGRFKVLRVRPIGWVSGESRAGVLRETCRVRAIRFLGADTLPLRFSGCTQAGQTQGTFPGQCVKGKAATPPRLNSDRSNSTRIPDQAAPSGGNCIFLEDCWACLHVFYSELQ